MPKQSRASRGAPRSLAFLLSAAVRCFARLLENARLKPRVPGRVHATEVIQAVGCSHQRVDFALASFKLSQIVQPGHDGRNSFLNQRNQLLAVHVLRLSSCRERGRCILLGFLVPSDYFVSQHSLQDAVHLKGGERALPSRDSAPEKYVTNGSTNTAPGDL